MKKTHDYSVKEWGHSCGITSINDDGYSIDLYGWGCGISNGDYIILKNGDDTTRYEIESVSYKKDPKDMWFASAKFSPRQ